MDLDQTIAALASPPGAAARGIIRISGDEAAAMIEACFVGSEPISPANRRGLRRAGHWFIADSRVRIPCDLLFWPHRRSYTGQPTAELHLPGSPPLLEKVLEDLYRRGVRPARPGEFTLRSFLAGKIDLLQAEAVLGVIDAHNDQELRTALDQLAGGISGRLVQLRGDLIDLLADLEAGLDFVEEDIEFVSRGEILSRISSAREFIGGLFMQSAARMTSNTVPKVVLAGLPNAGKSTLFNRLAGQTLAIVSPQEGTTRDYLRAELTWRGVCLELIDTAGWDDETAGIAGLAQSQRTDQLQRAALIVWCSADDPNETYRRRDEEGYQRLAVEYPSLLRLRTKADAARVQSAILCVSAHTGFGLEELRHRIAALLTVEASRTPSWLGMTAARCRDSLEHAAAALSRAEESAGLPSEGEELLAIDLRDALDHLGQIVGAVYTDDLLDRIFSKFCIGK